MNDCHYNDVPDHPFHRFRLVLPVRVDRERHVFG